ncbi:hypothetical protein G9A89_021932 [Geosiphon pyriformis]|nr:hypothetical protein G9A89_021932 [Geosiphon pyriformis]
MLFTVKDHFGISENEHTDVITGNISLSSWYLPLCLSKYFIMANGSMIFDNSRHFEIGSGSKFLEDDLLSNVDWVCFSLVWHLDLYMATGFTSRSSANAYTYFIKTLHHYLSVAIQKHLYSKLYFSVLCLYCGEVEVSDHVFSCKVDEFACYQLLDFHRNTLDNCKDSLREDPKQWEKTKVVTKTPTLTVLEFCHAIYTQNQSDLGLPEGCCPAESALTYYINARINYYIEKEKELHDAKLGLYKELSQYITKEVAVIAATIQYANENFLISTENTREHANKTKENLETNQENNQQKLETSAQTPKKTVT